MTVVPRVLLDHVDQDPSQARCSTVTPRALGQLIHAAVGHGRRIYRFGLRCAGSA